MAQAFLFLRRRATSASISASTNQAPYSSSSISHRCQVQLHVPASQYRCRTYRRTQICTRLQRLQNPSASTYRHYHSTFHPGSPFPANTYTPEQSTILSAALLHVPRHGFTVQSLTLGARDAGYLDVSLQLFPRGGGIELVLFWLGSRRSLLREKVEKGEMFQRLREGETEIHNKEPNMEEKVKMLILERLQMNNGMIHQWQDVSFCPATVPVIQVVSKLSLHMHACNECDILTRRA